MRKCPLCDYEGNSSYVVHQTELVYSMPPIEPLVEGHVMILPRAHKSLENLSTEELLGIRDMISRLKDRLKSLYPSKHPLMISQTDTVHSTIPGHVHFHLIPSQANVRDLMASYDHSIPARRRLPISELEKMAAVLKEP